MGLEEDATYRNRDPELLGKMYEYCRQDVNAERACAKHMLPLSDEEQKVWETDQIINLRGVNVDVDKVKDCIAIYEKKIEQLMEELKKMTGLENPNSQKQFLEWATKHGYTEDNLKAETLRDFLYVYRGREGEDILTQAITLKTMLSRTAPKKFYALLRRLSEDGRHRGAFMFHGAGTGRWASLGINLQNLLRPLMKDVDFIIELLGDRDPDILDLLWGDAITAIASCVRGMLIASPGNRLIICDYSAVEARIIAWLAGEQAVLEVFRQGKDVYIHAASGIFKIGESEVGPDERFAGKTAILACGFQGGWSALQKMASNYGVELEDGFCMMIVKKWRKANPRIVAYWAALERAAIEAVRNPGQEFLVEDFMEEKGKIPSVKYKVARGFLFCQLPSGRCLAYASPGLEKKTVRYFKIGEGDEERSIVYNKTAHGRASEFEALADKHGSTVNEFDAFSIRFFGTDSTTKQWVRQHLYGGLMAENVTQAVARDLLANAMVNAEKRDYPIVLHIHDELVSDKEKGQGSLDEFKQIVCDLPEWADGLPIDAEGEESERFKK
jgi:DNA polymerase